MHAPSFLLRLAGARPVACLAGVPTRIWIACFRNWLRNMAGFGVRVQWRILRMLRGGLIAPLCGLSKACQHQGRSVGGVQAVVPLLLHGTFKSTSVGDGTPPKVGSSASRSTSTLPKRGEGASSVDKARSESQSCLSQRSRRSPETQMAACQDGTWATRRETGAAMATCESHRRHHFHQVVHGARRVECSMDHAGHRRAAVSGISG